MTTFFVIAYSNEVAPAVNDQTAHHVDAETPAEALEIVRANYKHPAGFYSGVAYVSSDDYNEGNEPLAVLERR